MAEKLETAQAALASAEIEPKYTRERAEKVRLHNVVLHYGEGSTAKGRGHATLAYVGGDGADVDYTTVNVDDAMLASWDGTPDNLLTILVGKGV